MRTALYRLYAADGMLLYIGVTGELSVRFYYHSREKRWWPQVHGKRITWYDDRAEAEEAERCAILGENPVHNIFHTPAQGEVIRAAQRRTAGKHDHRGAGWSRWEAMPAYARKCGGCGAQQVAETDDPDVIVLCSGCWPSCDEGEPAFRAP